MFVAAYKTVFHYMALSYHSEGWNNKTFKEIQTIMNKKGAILELKGNIQMSKLIIEIYMKRDVMLAGKLK